MPGFEPMLFQNRASLRLGAIAIPPEMEWVLLRALGSPDQNLRIPIDPEGALEIADQILLTQRIARRTSTKILESELGTDMASRFEAKLRHGLAIEMQYKASCRLIAETAGRLGIDVIFLKGMALHLCGLVHPGKRPVSDIDVLVPESDCWRLHDALVDLGWQEKKRHSARERNLGFLWHPQQLAVEIHRWVGLLAIGDNGGRVSGEMLINGDLVIGVESFPNNAFVPRADVLLAHAAVHTLVQHRNNPAHFFRFLCDLDSVQDRHIGFVDLIAEAELWIIESEIQSCFSELSTTLERIAAGVNLTDVTLEETRAGQTLRHFIAATVDEQYQNILAKNEMLGTLYRMKFWPSLKELQLNYWDEISWFQYAFRALGRPFRFVRFLFKLSCVALRAR